MEERQVVREQLFKSYERVGRPGKVLLALSGGLDSMALLYLLMELQKDVAFHLSCVHVDHQLRPSSSQQALEILQFVWDLGIPTVLKTVTVSADGNQEEEARKARYQALYEAKEECGADVIALAHHAQDQAETLLMHLMRGMGPSSLSGMRELNGVLWRPMLQSSREDLERLHTTSGFPIFQDESNFDQSFLRNYLRTSVFPKLNQRWPKASLHMAKTAFMMADEAQAWEAEEQAFLSQHARMDAPFQFIKKAPLQVKHPSFQRRLLRRFILSAGINTKFEHIEALRQAMMGENGHGCNLPMGASLFISQEFLHLVLRQDETVHWTQLTAVPKQTGFGDGVFEQAFDEDEVRGATVRSARQGDMIIPLGMSGQQSVLKYLSARKIALPFRKHWPVLAKGNQVLWVIGCGPSQIASVQQSTKKTIRLLFNDQLPNELGLSYINRMGDK